MNKRRFVVVSIAIILLLCGCADAAVLQKATDVPSATISATLMQTLMPASSPSSTQQPTVSPDFEPSSAPDPKASTMWGAKFPEMFTDGGIIKNDKSVAPTINALSPRFQKCETEVVKTYKSAHVNITVNKVKENGITYYVADIYIADLKYFISPFSGGGYKKGVRKFVYDIARENGAVLAINGDYCANNPGPVLRDGVLYRNEVKLDILVMFKDGVMKTYTKDEYDKNFLESIKDDVWQIWTFGPRLLIEGEKPSEFNSPKKSIMGANPRTAVGYYEPGHYVFVVVDGRQPGYSDPGFTMEELSQLMHDLGCKEAFNLDGGGTSQMAFMGKWVNRPSVHRKTRDALCIVDS